MLNFVELIKTLEKTSSTKEKIALIHDNLDATNYMLFELALNPLKLFGIKTIPEHISISYDIDYPYIICKLNSLVGQNNSNTHRENIVDFLSKMSKEQSEIVSRILLKDLKCGVSVANFNKALKDTNYQPILDYPCQLVSAYSEKLIDKLDWANGVFVQEKCDGMRFNAIVRGELVEFFGRSGKPITILNEDFKSQFQKLRANFDVNMVFDGELLVKREGKILDRKTGNGILNKAVRGTVSETESSEIVCKIWDYIPLIKFEQAQYDEPYGERYHRLNNVTQGFSKIEMVETIFTQDREKAFEMFNDMLAQGKEGVIIKSPWSKWRNTRVTDCVKLKAEKDCDLRLVQIDKAKEGSKYDGLMGALVFESADGKVRVSVGTGFTDQERADYLDEKYIGQIATITYNERIKDKNRTEFDSLFLPRFVEWRIDKSEADTSDKIK